MNDVNELINECVEKLHTYDDAIHVGNRPHYPLSIMFNEVFDNSKISEVYKRLKRFWPSSIKRELFYRYISCDNDFSLEKYDNSNFFQVTTEDVETDIRDVSTHKDAHTEFNRWRLINVIDTKGMESSGDFKISYDYLPKFNEILGNQIISLLVVLLRDEKSMGEDAADHLRNFLSEQYKTDSDNIRYDAVVIISDLKADNTRMTEVEMLSALSNIIIVSDNDAVSEWDDSDYADRSLTLSGEKIYSIAYRHLERPNEMISKQICDVILTAAREESLMPANESGILRMIGINNGKIDLVENMLNKLTQIINADFLYALPVRNEAVQDDFKIEETLFSTVKGYLADVSIIDIVAEAELENAAVKNIIETVTEHISKCLKNLPLSYWENNDDFKINGVPFVNAVDIGNVREQSTIKDYFFSVLARKIRKRILERFSSVVREVSSLAIETKPYLENTVQSFNEIRPIQGYADLGQKYKNIADSYVSSQQLSNDLMIHNIAYPGNAEKEILSNIKKCFDQIVETNYNGVFSKSFNEEWEMRLGQKSDLIYRKIMEELEITDNICLKGNYPYNIRLRIYMLHTFDDSGNNETGLYRYLHGAFKNTDSVQYINTGFDDELDAISFVEIKPEDLTL